MNIHLTVGRVFYSIALIGLGILCLIFQDFIVGRPPGWSDGPGESILLTFLPGFLFIVSGFCVLFNFMARYIAVLVMITLVYPIVMHLINFADWLNALKTFAILGGTIIVWASFETDREGVINKDRISTSVFIGCLLIAAFFVGAGYAHFIYASFVETLIPSFIPFRLFWTYFCGICLVAGGVGIVIPQTRRLASLLSGIMVFGWFLLLHIPRFLMNPADPSDRLGLMESLLIAGVLFVLRHLSASRIPFVKLIGDQHSAE